MQKSCLSLLFAAGVAAVGLGADPASATGTAATPIAAEDFTAGEARTLGPAPVSYDPQWAAADAAGGHVVLRKIVNADTSAAVTSVVATCEADASGVYSLALASEAERNVRLLHTVEVDGEPVGKTLVADLGFGKGADTPSAAIFAASTNALQTIADEKGVAPLAYSTDWAEGVTKVKIDYSYEQWRKGKKYGDGAGTLFSADADASGAFEYDIGNAIGGDYTLTYTMYGEDDEVLGTSTAFFSLPFRPGALLMPK